MLKIINNYDLKHLEDYGFEKNYIVDEWAWVKKYEQGKYYKEGIFIWKDKRNIQLSNCINLANTLYDMIKDGIVEKVNE